MTSQLGKLPLTPIGDLWLPLDIKKGADLTLSRSHYECNFSLLVKRYNFIYTFLFIVTWIAGGALMRGRMTLNFCCSWPTTLLVPAIKFIFMMVRINSDVFESWYTCRYINSCKYTCIFYYTIHLSLWSELHIHKF